MWIVKFPVALHPVNSCAFRFWLPQELVEPHPLRSAANWPFRFNKNGISCRKCFRKRWKGKWILNACLLVKPSPNSRCLRSDDIATNAIHRSDLLQRKFDVKRTWSVDSLNEHSSTLQIPPSSRWKAVSKITKPLIGKKSVHKCVIQCFKQKNLTWRAINRVRWEHYFKRN